MAKNKKVIARIKMKVPAGNATPAPPVGSTLGQYGLNIQDFINPFNEQTQDQRGAELPVHLTIYEDRSFDFKVKGEPTADLIRKTLKLDKGSGEPNKEKVGKLTQQQVEEIAQSKMSDLNVNDIDAAKQVVAGTARSMGVEVE